jgi:hypothetical protein
MRNGHFCGVESIKSVNLTNLYSLNVALPVWAIYYRASFQTRVNM